MTVPAQAPTDVTVGEVWRGMGDIRSELATVSAEVRGLPSALAKEIDDRTGSLVEVLRSETNLRIAPIESRVVRLERALWGVIAFVFAANGAAILALILHR